MPNTNTGPLEKWEKEAYLEDIRDYKNSLGFWARLQYEITGILVGIGCLIVIGIMLVLVFGIVYFIVQAIKLLIS